MKSRTLLIAVVGGVLLTALMTMGPHAPDDHTVPVGTTRTVRRPPVQHATHPTHEEPEAEPAAATAAVAAGAGPAGEAEGKDLPSLQDAKPLVGSAMTNGGSSSSCGFISFLFCRFIDIDFIEFVLSSHPQPRNAKIVDIGVYQGGELVQMARQGFNVDAYEPNPFRFNKSRDEIDALPAAVRSRIRLNQNAVADRRSKLYFQRAGLDSHIYFPEDPTKLKPQTIVVEGIPIADVITESKYFVKIDTQGFDTRIVENLLDALAKSEHTVAFIQFEFSPHFEVTRAERTKEDHRRTFRRLLDAGYDVFQGAAVQPWLKSHRGTYGKTPLAMLAPAANVPTCIDEFVDFMHKGKTTPIHPGKTSTDSGTWMDVLAVKRLATTPYYRHTGWVLSRHM